VATSTAIWPSPPNPIIPNFLAGLDLTSSHYRGVRSHSRFSKYSQLKRYFIWNTDKRIFSGKYEFAEAAIILVTVVLVHRPDCDSVANRILANIDANRNDFTSYLVAGDNRKRHQLEPLLILEQSHIRVANADRPYSYKDLT
jgi:hypothetical protein